MLNKEPTFMRSGLNVLAPQTVRFLIAGFVALGFMVGPPSQSMAITYGVNLVIGTVGVKGFIKTDGTIGALAASNITDWTLQLSNGTDTVTIFGPLSGNDSDLEIILNPFDATKTDLNYDFGLIDASVRFKAKTVINTEWLIRSEVSAGDPPSLAITLENITGDIAFLPSNAGIQGIAQTPEPGTMLLLGSGLASLAAWRMRKGQA